MTPIKLLTDLLAEMTERALKAEQELSAEKERADLWYKQTLKQKETIEEAKMLLEQEIENHQQTVKRLRELEGGAVHA